MMRTFIFILTLISLTACDTSKSDSSQAPQLYPEQNSLAFQQFSKQCSACHRPPMPNQHTAQEWESVIAVMQTHKAQAGMEIMTPAESKQVLAYLQKHSRTQ